MLTLLTMNSNKPKITPALPRGMRDLLPDQLAVRYKVIETLRRVFELYGFQPLETPAMERLEILSGKGGEESDKLSFLVMKRGDELQKALEKVKTENLSGKDAARELADMGLRYDLTVPLARVAAMYPGKLPMPFKRYQIAPVWRAERPQHGRYREFTQCDVDIVGTDSPVADAEIIALLLDGYDAIGRVFKLSDWNIVIKVNHRGILRQLSEAIGNQPEQFTSFCLVLDKLDKIGQDAVTKEMGERGLKTDILPAMWDILSQANNLQNLFTVLEPLRSLLGSKFDYAPFESIRDLVWNWELTSGFQFAKVESDFTLARGLDYYTGVVFEVVVTNGGIGSLGGGGRYDQLVASFSNQPLPAVGVSFGLERIVDVITNQLGDRTSEMPKVVPINVNPEAAPSYLRRWIASELRGHLITCEFPYVEKEKTGKQIQDAQKIGASHVILIDEEIRKVYPVEKRLTNRDSLPDLSNLEFETKRLFDGEQRRLTLPQIVEWIKESTK